MTRLRLAVALLAFVAVAVALIPLRFVLQFVDLSASRLDPGFASGSIWSGRLEGASWQGADLGDFRVSLSPVDLLGGAVRFRFTSPGVVREGAWLSTADGGRLERLKGLLPLDRLIAGAPTGAFISFLDGSVVAAGAGCSEASGRILVDGLSDVGLSAMEGAVRCEAGRLVVALASQDGARLDLAFDMATAAVTGRSADPAILAVLQGLGVETEGSDGT